MNQDVRVFGTASCQDTKAVHHHLDSLGVQYEHVDVESDQAAAEWVKQHAGGRQLTPMLRIGDDVLIKPSEREIEERLRGRGLMG